MCVHRGVEVAEGRGNTRAFKCPYHGWIYDLEGKLTGAAHMKDSAGFDLSNCRLRPIRVETWRRNIFITFRSEEHTSELQSLMRISYAVFCLKKKKKTTRQSAINKRNKTYEQYGKNKTQTMRIC